MDEATPANPDSDEYRHARLRERLEILTVLVRAQDRRDEVIAAVGSADSDDAARDRVAALLGLEHAWEANAVLDQQLRRMTARSRDEMQAQVEELRSELGA